MTRKVEMVMLVSLLSPVELAGCAESVLLGSSVGESAEPPVLDPDAPGASCPGVLDPSHVHAHTYQAGVGASVFVDLDDRDIECANALGADGVPSGSQSNYWGPAVNPGDGGLYYLARSGGSAGRGETWVVRAVFDTLEWSETEFGGGSWQPVAGQGADEVATKYDAVTCGGVTTPRLLFHGASGELGVLCEGGDGASSPGLSLLALDGRVLTQWSDTRLIPQQFLDDGRVVFGTLEGRAYVAEGDPDDVTSVKWHDGDPGVEVAFQMVGDDLYAARVVGGPSVELSRRERGYFETEASLGEIDLDADNAFDVSHSVLVEDDGSVVVRTSFRSSDPNDDAAHTRTLVQRFSPLGVEALFDEVVDEGDVVVGGRERDDPEAVLLIELLGAR